MSHALIVAVDDGRDAALAFARWVAEEAAARIAHHRVRVGDIRRASLRAELADHPEGASLHGHGLPHAVLDAEGDALLGAEDLSALDDGGWLHAFACYSGEGELAVRAGATPCVFAGYRGPVLGFLYVDRLPPPLREGLARLCCAATVALSQHETSREAIRALVIRAWGDFHAQLDACLDAVDAPTFQTLSQLANTLRSGLVLTGAALRA